MKLFWQIREPSENLEKADPEAKDEKDPDAEAQKEKVKEKGKEVLRRDAGDPERKDRNVHNHEHADMQTTKRASEFSLIKYLTRRSIWDIVATDATIRRPLENLFHHISLET